MTASTQFWDWFQRHHTTYTLLGSVETCEKDQLLDDLLANLHAYCDQLYFQIGGYEEDDLELIITAEGRKEYFPQVEALVQDAPLMEGWTVTPFKQPAGGHFKIHWDDITLDTNDVWFEPLESEGPSHLGIRVYLRNHDRLQGKEQFRSVLCTFIETIVGEAAFARDIDYIDSELQPGNPEEEDLMPILELPEYIDWHRQQ